MHAINASKEGGSQTLAKVLSRSPEACSSNPTCTRGSGSRPSTLCGQTLRIRHSDKISFSTSKLRDISPIIVGRSRSESHTNMRLTTERTHFRLPQIDFSSSSVWQVFAMAGQDHWQPTAGPDDPAAHFLTELVLTGTGWDLRETETAGRCVNNRLADGQGRCCRGRRNVEHVQHLAGRYELEIID
jgi:hypothetical protein